MIKKSTEIITFEKALFMNLSDTETSPKKEVRVEPNGRAQQLLKLVVEHFIAEGTPVASKSLANLPGVDVSSATVRNVMGDLESMGLVRSPHTSAGKVPTQMGLRFFVDSLLSFEPVTRQRMREFEDELDPSMSPTQLVNAASELLSEFTKMTCLITTPRRNQITLRQIEFLRLDESRVLAILVLNDRDVQNRVIHVDESFTDSELTVSANLLNQEFGGGPLSEIREAVAESLRSDKSNMDGLMRRALSVVDGALKTEDSSKDEHDLVVSGERRLLDFTADTEKARTLFDAISGKGRLLHLLDQCIASDGVQLFIGQESGYRPLGDMSLVTSTYQLNGELAGALGVIGPTRMDYKDVIPVVDVTARLLSAAMRRG